MILFGRVDKCAKVLSIFAVLIFLLNDEVLLGMCLEWCSIRRYEQLCFADGISWIDNSFIELLLLFIDAFLNYIVSEGVALMVLEDMEKLGIYFLLSLL